VGDGHALRDEVTQTGVVHDQLPTRRKDDTPNVRATRTATPYGQWSRCFAPGAADLYSWLRSQASGNLVVISNFHEYLSLETGLPTLPIPKDVDTLIAWVERIKASRGITEPRVLFVLDPDNKWRDYWMAKPEDVVRTFALRRSDAAPSGVSAWIFEQTAM